MYFGNSISKNLKLDTFFSQNDVFYICKKWKPNFRFSWNFKCYIRPIKCFNRACLFSVEYMHSKFGLTQQLGGRPAIDTFTQDDSFIVATADLRQTGRSEAAFQSTV